MRVLLNVPLNPYSGYGQDGLGLVQAWLRRGADVYVQPTNVGPPLPKDVAAVLTKDLKAPFDLAIVHLDPGQLVAGPGMRRAADMVVGWTMWEWTRLDNMRWDDLVSLPTRLETLDGLVLYDHGSYAAVEEWTDFMALRGQEVPALATLQGGYAAEKWPEVDREWHGTFRFFMEGALHDRKNPFCAIEAYRELRAEHPEAMADVELHLKTVEPGLHHAMEQWAPGLKVHYQVWEEDYLRAFYQNVHCLLAPSRGEGKNLPALQFLSTGGTAIVSDCPGHRMWQSSEYALRISSCLRELPDGSGSCGVDADKADLKELMLRLVTHRDEARRMGACAARTIPSMCGWDTAVERLVQKLPELAGRRGRAVGEAVRDRALAATRDSALGRAREGRRERERETV